jgi:hypothetical protein
VEWQRSKGRKSRKEFVVKMEMSDTEDDDVKTELAGNDAIVSEAYEDGDIKEEIKVELKEK